MMALKNYLRNKTYEAKSLSGLVRQAEKEEIESLNIIINYTYKMEYIESARTSVTYEAILKPETPQNKIRFTKNYNMSPLEAIAYTGRRVSWLKKKLNVSDKKVKFLNNQNKDMRGDYELMLKLAQLSLSRGKPFNF
jgi:hypothetical protein